MKIKIILFTMFVMSVLCLSALGETAKNSRADPLVLGHGVDLFKVGPLLTQDNFEDLKNWVVQIQKKSGFAPAKVQVRDNSLDCLLPGRGCTVWFKKKLKTRVTIMYEVLCPTPKPAIKGVQPRDINNFWMATDPADPGKGLFDSIRYTGKFGSYDKMKCYYASTGGGGAEKANLTTRFRRYPREVNGMPAEHLALNDKDGKREYLITPDKVMTVQLVAYDDVIQYIVNGKLNYQIARGDKVQVEGRDNDGERITSEAPYDLKRFPVYREGYFGFRMVGTHHIYRNFRVYTLVPDDDKKSDPAWSRANETAKQREARLKWWNTARFGMFVHWGIYSVVGGEYKGDYKTFERRIPKNAPAETDWEVCMPISGSWGYKRSDRKFKSIPTLIRNLADIASKGGNYLLNVSPTGEGTLLPESIERLKAIGRWMKINSESIYGTTASPFATLDWGRCTKKVNVGGAVLYLHVFNWPEDGKLLVPGLKNKVNQAYLIADQKTLETALTDSGIVVSLPQKAPDEINSVVVLKVSGELDIESVLPKPNKDGSLILSADMAYIHNNEGTRDARVQEYNGIPNIGYWTDEEAWLEWTFKIERPGRYEIRAELAVEEDKSRFHLGLSGRLEAVEVSSTGGYKKYVKKSLGEITVDKAGTYVMQMKPEKKIGNPLTCGDWN